MKKYDLLKLSGITLLIVALITWVIPAGGFSSGVYKSLETTYPIGIYDLLRLPVVAIVTFIQYGLLMLAIGGFYGVLNKTGVYSKVVNDIVKKVENNKKLFLVLTVILFSVLVSVVGLPNVMFVLVPFFVAILLKLGYSKITSFAATVGSILFGQVGTTFAFSIWGFLKYVFKVPMTEIIWARIILLVMIVVLFTLFLLKNNKEEKNTKKSKKKEEVVELTIPLYEETTSKKSSLPLIILCIITFVLLAVGLYNWYYAFEIKTFANIQEKIKAMTFGDYPLISNLLGNVTELGFLSNYDAICVLILSALVIGWIYNIKISDIVSSFVDGMKQMLRPALYAMLSCTVFVYLINITQNYGGEFVYTIISKLYTPDKFNLLGAVGGTAVASFAYNDFFTLVTNMANVFVINSSVNVKIVALVLQTIPSLVMIIAPTSIYLLAGLSYLDIPYKEWIKYIWKIFLVVTGVVIVTCFILMTII